MIPQATSNYTVLQLNLAWLRLQCRPVPWLRFKTQSAFVCGCFFFFEDSPVLQCHPLLLSLILQPVLLSSFSGPLLLAGVSEALQPHGSQQLLAAGLLFLLLLILLRLTHQDGVRLLGLRLRALPLSALHPPGLLLHAQLLAGSAGELLCP